MQNLCCTRLLYWPSIWNFNYSFSLIAHRNIVPLRTLFLFSGMLFSGLFTYVPSFTHCISARGITTESFLISPTHYQGHLLRPDGHLTCVSLPTAPLGCCPPLEAELCVLICVSSISDTDQALSKLLFHKSMLSFLVFIPPSPIWKSKKIFQWDKWLLKWFIFTCKLLSF